MHPREENYAKKQLVAFTSGESKRLDLKEEWTAPVLKYNWPPSAGCSTSACERPRGAPPLDGVKRRDLGAAESQAANQVASRIYKHPIRSHLPPQSLPPSTSVRHAVKSDH